MTKCPDAKQIKSAKRVFEVLQFFNANRQQGTVMDIAREYGYPQSSTSELLSCMVELGFLSRSRFERTYRPTAKVAAIGAWIHPRLFRQGKLLSMMDALADETGCTIVLSGAVGVKYQHFHIVPGGSSEQPVAAENILTQGAIGPLLLAVRDRLSIRNIVHRLNSEAAPELRVRCEDFMLKIEQIRRQGFASTLGEEVGIVAVRLPQQAGGEVLALGIVAEPSEDRDLAYHLRALRNAIASSLGPVLAHAQVPAQVPERAELRSVI